MGQEKRWKVATGLLVAAMLMVVRSAVAHAILMESSPAAGSTVPGPDVSIRLRFNSRVDAARSRIALMQPDGTTRTIRIEKQPSPDTLTSQVKGLKPGDYQIRWQVLAEDGHITRGQVRFTVGGA